MPAAAGSAPSLRVTTTEVLVPTLVEKDGAIVYGLKPSDFVLEDNGVPQKIKVQEEMDTAPVALVVAVERGGASVLEFSKLARLGPLLDVFLFDQRSQVALVGFDSAPHLITDFTHSGDEVNKQLTELRPGNGGAAILDTVNYAVTLLESQPKEYRRVLLLISEERDHGSKHTKPVQLIKRIGESDVLVLSVSFSPGLAEFSSGYDAPILRPDDAGPHADARIAGADRRWEFAGAADHGDQRGEKECDQRGRRDERRRVHNFLQRQGFRGGDHACGAGCAQPVLDYLQSVGPNAGAALDSGADGRGLWGADCGESELLARCAMAVTRRAFAAWCCNEGTLRDARFAGGRVHVNLSVDTEEWIRKE